MLLSEDMTYIEREPEMVNYIFTVVAALEINHPVCSLEGDLCVWLERCSPWPCCWTGQELVRAYKLCSDM